MVGGQGLPIADAAALTGGQALPWTSPAETLARVLALLARTPAHLALENAERFLALETVTGETRWLARFAGSAPGGLVRAEARDLEALWARAHVALTSSRADAGHRRSGRAGVVDVERHLRSGAPTPGACILAANLLREAGQPHEAGRILSEAAAVDPVGAIAEFRRWASTADVSRLGELAARK